MIHREEPTDLSLGGRNAFKMVGRAGKRDITHFNWE